MPVTGTVDAPPSSDLAARVANATLACIARTGLGKLTVDDVARQARTSRATIYRVFPSKQALVAATAEREAERILAAIAADAAGAPAVDDVVAAVILVGTRELRASAALVFVAAHEPELIFPHLEFAGGDALYGRLGSSLAPLFAPWVAEPERLAEWVARIGLSLLWSPVPLVDPTDELAVRKFVSTFVTPGIAGPAEAASVPEEG